MCDEVVIDGEYFENVGQLRARLGEIDITFDDPKSGDNCCLCVVDMAATAKRHGYLLYRDEVMFFHFLRPGEKPSSRDIKLVK